jgi:hypothetical protein
MVPPVETGRLMRLRAALETASVREHAAVSTTFLAGRWLLHLAGIRLNFILEWMFLSDPDELRNRMVETVYFSHAYPPGMNVLTGILLKLGGSHTPRLAHFVLESFGLVLVNSFFYLCRVSEFSFRAAFAISLAFSLIPQSIYFEHLYLYETPVAALLCLAVALFHYLLRHPSFLGWSGFFAICAAIGWTRSTFHLVWFGAMLGLALWFSDRSGRRRVLGAAALPAAALVALYAKNLVVFGLFGASTSGPANLTEMTVRRLPAELRETWVKEGKLSPFASVDIFAGPRAYLPYFPSSENPKWPPMMNELERPSLGASNYNHWFFLEVNPNRRDDAVYCLKLRPYDYAATVLENLKRLFQPTTEWHPLDKSDKSPHHQHRRVLGAYETFYNSVVHGFPAAPVGLYAFLPIAWIWAFLNARALLRTHIDGLRARGALIYVCLFQIAFVVPPSILFAFGEAPRYRYAIEPMIWLIAGMAVARGWVRMRDRLRVQSAT